MSDPLVLRSAMLADGPAVIRIWFSCGLVVPHNPPERDFERAVTEPSSEIFIAEISAEVVGTVMVGDDGHRAWIYYLAVEPAHRFVGLGARLVEAAEHWASERGARKIQLMIRPSNTIVGTFYASQGYAETPRVVMAKWLDPDMTDPSPANRN